MRKIIYLVRHAESQTNANPLFAGKINDLTKLGLVQAKAAASVFKNINIEAIYSSPILRAEVTAQEISKITDVSLTKIDLLKERKCFYSVAEDKYMPEEQFADFHERLIKTKDFLEKLPQQRIVIVGHAFFLTSLIGLIILKDKLTEDFCEHISRTLLMDYATISKLNFNTEKEKWLIEFWNDKFKS